MYRSIFLFIMVMTGLVSIPAYALPPLQLFVELTPTGTTLRPPPGTYAGPVIINRAITLDGGGEVIIDGGGEDTVVAVETDDVVIRGLKIRNSGTSHDQVNAGLLLHADNAVVENNVFENVLFGIHIKNANNNIIRGNTIRSRNEEFKSRGEGIRMWYSHDNLIENNDISHVRDLFFTNSSSNKILNNKISDSRIGMQFVFSPDNFIEGNLVSNNSTGIVVMYSNDLTIRGNQLSHMRSISGSAFSLKESSGVSVKDNDILHCAFGVIANAPMQPENIYHIQNNRFAYNDIGLYFYGEKGGHVITDNRFENNFTDVAVSSASTARANNWQGNYWGNYIGFDMDGDGKGDTPHNIFLYADRVWRDRRMAQFFRASPVLEVIDFVERLAPFSEPELILRDSQPKMQ
ncbi:MAG: nitrous oxide reductase family maturation protein NosD [Gammaproteobacteria bacterium]|nr:nitrous oxide reductase family maturation protein NosD [Gammaproteobacteria bacterium]